MKRLGTEIGHDEKKSTRGQINVEVLIRSGRDVMGTGHQFGDSEGIGDGGILQQNGIFVGPSGYISLKESSNSVNDF